MKGRMFPQNPIQAKFTEKDQLNHQKRLQEIQNKDIKLKSVEKDIGGNIKMSQTRHNNLKFGLKGKTTEIEQENEMLLGRLVEISRKKSPMFPERPETYNVKSLHAPYRKKQMDRISMENEALAKRLISQQSTFSRKKLEQDYKRHRELVSNLKRVSTSQPKIVSKKLPPLQPDVKSPKQVANFKSIQQDKIGTGGAAIVNLKKESNSNTAVASHTDVEVTAKEASHNDEKIMSHRDTKNEKENHKDIEEKAQHKHADDKNPEVNKEL